MREQLTTHAQLTEQPMRVSARPSQVVVMPTRERQDSAALQLQRPALVVPVVCKGHASMLPSMQAMTGVLNWRWGTVLGLILADDAYTVMDLAAVAAFNWADSNHLI